MFGAAFLASILLVYLYTFPNILFQLRTTELGKWNWKNILQIGKFFYRFVIQRYLFSILLLELLACIPLKFQERYLVKSLDLRCSLYLIPNQTLKSEKFSHFHLRFEDTLMALRFPAFRPWTDPVGVDLLGWHVVASIGPSLEQSIALSTEACFSWPSTWFWNKKPGWAVAWPGLCKPSWSLRQGIHCHYYIFPWSKSRCPWPALFASTIRWKQNHCRS